MLQKYAIFADMEIKRFSNQFERHQHEIEISPVTILLCSTCSSCPSSATAPFAPSVTNESYYITDCHPAVMQSRYVTIAITITVHNNGRRYYRRQSHFVWRPWFNQNFTFIHLNDHFYTTILERSNDFTVSIYTTGLTCDNNNNTKWE